KVSGMSDPTNTLSDTVTLQQRPDPNALGVLQMRTLVQTNGMTIQTSYYWPKSPGGILVVYSPLLQFAETRISGLTTTPIVLTDYYAQSYGAYHHNFYEEFIFEPRLDPAVPAQTLAELKAANIQLIYAWTEGGRRTVFYVQGYDQKLRKL
ncbi:MAG TPA: hypothetical protein VNZ22_11630, partial [Bacillota bacterium]|nr:hypothetical protein [Bacillota bacterium]